MTIDAPAGHADELTMLLGYLDMQRDVMVMKVEDLSEEEARFKPTPEANSLLNLIVHLTGVERRWFRRTILGEDFKIDRSAEFGELTVTVPDAIAAYRRGWNEHNEIVRGSSVDESCKGESGYSVRWVLLHLIEETARHCGHADITRELIDGAVGYNRTERD